jgi:hypothetical protein
MQKAHSLYMIFEMPFWFWCGFTVSISCMTIDNNEAVLRVCKSFFCIQYTHPSFCNGAEIYPHCLSPLSPLQSLSSLTISKEVDSLRRIYPLEGRLDWPITGCSRCDMNKLPPSKSLFFYYVWTSNFMPVQGRSLVGLVKIRPFMKIPLPFIFPLPVLDPLTRAISSKCSNSKSWLRIQLTFPYPFIV